MEKRFRHNFGYFSFCCTCTKVQYGDYEPNNLNFIDAYGTKVTNLETNGTFVGIPAVKQFNSSIQLFDWLIACCATAPLGCYYATDCMYVCTTSMLQLYQGLIAGSRYSPFIVHRHVVYMQGFPTWHIHVCMCVHVCVYVAVFLFTWPQRNKSLD